MAEKVTIKQFSEKLKEYTNGSAARKAVGRFNGWSEEEKAKARKMIDAQFGPVEVVVKVPAKRGRPAKVAAKVPARRGRPPKAVKATRAPRKAASPKEQMELAPVELPSDMGEVLQQIQQQPGKDVVVAAIKRHTAERAIQVCAVAAQTVHTIHQDQPSLDLTSAWMRIVDTQNRALDLFSKELDGVEMVEEKVTTRRPRAAKTSEAPKGNGTKDTSEDDKAFASPLAPIPTQI
jgi:hypothetical protein